MIKNDSSTFAHQDALPALPVPPLGETLTKFLQSIQPLLSAEVRFATADLFRISWALSASGTPSEPLFVRIVMVNM